MWSPKATKFRVYFVVSCGARGDGVLFAERANEYIYVAMSKPLYGEGAGKPSLNRAIMQREYDPKPSELAMTRVKFVEGRMEARTRVSFNSLG